MEKLSQPIRCHYCKAIEAPLIEPTGKKRLVMLVCACCGNPMCVRYVPKGRKTKYENPGTD